MKINKLGVCLVVMAILFVVGTSYAIWQLTLTQTDKNTVTTSCFKLDFQEENDIRLENAYPITDEEGKVLTPYTFTITSLCESNAKYQINLEVLNDTTLEDVSILKVMLDDKINLLTDKTIVTPTLDNAKTSYLLKTGYLRNGESKNFSLRLWMNEDTPPNLEYMNKVFLSKVTITASYLDNLENTIASTVTSLNTGYDKNEMFSIHLTSEKYDIVSVSDDGSSFEELEEQGKDVTLEKIINTNGSYTFYVKDEAGNISEVLLNATKVDDQKPIPNMTVTKTNNVINIDASGSLDNETSILKYYYSKDGTNYEESKENHFQFTEEYEYGLAATTITNFEKNQIKKVYVKVEDAVGNVSDVKEFSITDTDFAYDETVDNNLRYIGANPNNYIDIGDRDKDGNVILWRIIGLMNNVDDGEGNKETRLKVIRSEGIGEYSWDTSASGINFSYGINEWSQSDVMKLLNPGYETESINGSLYWNRRNGYCFNGENNANGVCDFTSIGLSDESKLYIGNALWNLGSNGYNVYNAIKTDKFYELENSSNSGRICTNGEYCNESLTRVSVWKGMVGLMSPSDYGYATKGGATTSRSTCLNTNLFNWDGSGVSDCKNNNWLINLINWQWTMMPVAHESYSSTVFFVYTLGSVDHSHARYAGLVRPAIYIKSSTKIIDGVGSILNPFKISLETS